MKLISKIHGEIQYEEKDIVTFKKGILGFEELKKFIIVDLEGYEPFKLLQSLENTDIGMVVTSPYEFFKDYKVKLSDETLETLQIKSPKEVMILNTVTLHSDAKKITTNLQGPIVINTVNQYGEQIIIDNSKYKVKQPLI